GEGSEARFQQFPWYYSPLINPEGNHPIVNNLNLVKFDFANQIDTLKNNIQKTILLQSSLLSKTDGTPREVSLEMTTMEPDPQLYNKPHQPMAVLLEGAFTSVYNNRDRKSTRLNSSHVKISYAVFCLKKKINHK